MTCFDEEPEHQPTKEEWELATAKRLLSDALCVLSAHAIGHKTQEAIHSFLEPKET